MIKQLKNINYRTAAIILLVAAVIIACLVRIPYGVEVTDEAYYVAEAYIVSNGAVPFVDNWTQSPGATLFYAPLMKIFVNLTGGTEGIFLFSRLAYFIFKILISICIIVTLKKHIPISVGMLFCLPYIALFPASISMFSYNTLSISFSLFACIILFAAVNHDNKRNAQILSIIAGAFMAISATSHLYQILNCLLIGLIFLFIERQKRKESKLIWGYLLGGIFTAFVIFLIVALSAKESFNIARIIKIMSAQPYFKIDKIPYLQNLSSLAFSIKQIFLFLCICLAIYILFASYSILNENKYKKINQAKEKNTAQPVKMRRYFESILAGSFIYIVFSYYKYMNGELFYSIICCVFAVIPLLLYFIIKKEQPWLIELYYLVFLPCLMILIANTFATFTSISYRLYYLLPGVMLSILFMYYSARIIYEGKNKDNNRKILAYPYLITILTGLICLCFLTNYYKYIYRDEPINKLSYKVESGIYKGLYTTENRGKALILLEDEIKKVTNKNDRVLFMDLAPQAYLMTQAEHCTPSTWDITLYEYGFTSDYLLRSYFEVSNKVPTKIIYIKRDIDEPLSITTSNYEFNQYVNENYHNTYQNDADMFEIIVYEHN